MFKELAQKSVGGSFVSEGREKVKLDDLMTAYEDGVTIIAADLWKGENGDYCAVNIAEDDKIYFTGGKALTEIVQGWVKGFDGDCEAMSKALTGEGGVKMKFEKTTTKAGRTFTNVTVM